jgi:hypothetical protein
MPSTMNVRKETTRRLRLLVMTAGEQGKWIPASTGMTFNDGFTLTHASPVKGEEFF